jgi:hypothetical protein
VIVERLRSVSGRLLVVPGEAEGHGQEGSGATQAEHGIRVIAPPGGSGDGQPS